MSYAHTLTEAVARDRIEERVADAARPRIPAVPQRHRVAERLRRFADRLDN